MHTGLKGMLYGAAAALAIAGAAPFALAASCGDVNGDGSLAINDVSIHLNVVSGVDSCSRHLRRSGLRELRQPER